MKKSTKLLIFLYIIFQIINGVRFYFNKNLRINQILIPSYILMTIIILICIVKGINLFMKFISDI